MSNHSIYQNKNNIEDNVNWDSETVYEEVESEDDDERHIDLKLVKSLKIAHATSSSAGGSEPAVDNAFGLECTSAPPPTAAAMAATFCQAISMRRHSDFTLRRHSRKDSSDILIPHDGFATPRSLILSMAASTGRLRALSLSGHSVDSMNTPPLSPRSEAGETPAATAALGTPSPHSESQPPFAFPPTDSLHGMLDALGDALRNPLQALRSSFDLLRQTHYTAPTGLPDDPWVIADDCITRLAHVADLVAGNESENHVAAVRPSLVRTTSVPVALPQTGGRVVTVARPPAGARVLVTDDDPVVRKLLVRSLEKAGLVCDVATDGAEAYQMATGTPYPFARRSSGASTSSTIPDHLEPTTPLSSPPPESNDDDTKSDDSFAGMPPIITTLLSPAVGPALAYDAIVMDVHMPLVDGITTTRALRAFGVHTPIIGLSGHSRPEYRVSALDAGMDAFVQKPCRWTHLLDVLAKHMVPSTSESQPTPRRTIHPQRQPFKSDLFVSPVEEEMQQVKRGRTRALSLGSAPFAESHGRRPLSVTTTSINPSLLQILAAQGGTDSTASSSSSLPSPSPSITTFETTGDQPCPSPLITRFLSPRISTLQSIFYPCS